MPDKKPNRPEHSPEGYEWLPDAFARDVKPHGSEARESVRRAFAEGNNETLLRTLIGERHPIPNRMWDKEPVAQKVYQRFEDGWMTMRLKLWTGHYVEGWIFVRQGALRKILDEGKAASKHRDTVADGAVKDEPELVAPEPAVEGTPQQPRRKKPAKAMHDQQQKKAPRPRGRGGRKPGSGAYTNEDRVLWEKMKAALEQSDVVSPWGAAGLFAEEAPGDGTFDSKRSRLAKGYSGWISTQ